MKYQDKKSIKRYQAKIERARSNSHINPFETKLQQQEAIAKAKKDFAYMVQRYFPHYATAKTPKFHVYFAKKVKKDKTFKGFAQWGRALSKSVLNNILLPFWLWINGEPVYLVLVGNNYDRAVQLLEDIRAEFEANDQIINDFGDQYNLGNWEEGFFITKGGFIGQALGMGQSVRGLRVKSRRPTHIVCDDIETKDINKNPKRQNETVKWIERDLVPTMDGDTRRFIQANNRFAPVMIQTKLQDKHPNWFVHQINAYDPVSYHPTWPEKYTAQYFKDLEDEIGRLAALSEYNNSPHIEGSIFTQKEIQYAKLPRLNQFKIIYGYWDVAYAGTSTADFNAVVVQGLKDKSFWVIDTYCKQSRMQNAIRWMCAFQKQLPKTVIVHWAFEAQFWNDAVETAIEEVELEENVHLNLIKVNNPRTKKYDRILRLQPYYQNGRIFYNKAIEAKNDHQEGLAQLLGIEPGYKTHDDYPDAHQGGISLLEPYVVQSKTHQSGYHLGKYAKKYTW